MRAKSLKTKAYTIYAVAGTNTISFAIDSKGVKPKDKNGLLGFAIERINHYTGERKFLDGFKVFKEVIKNPSPALVVSTYRFPIQSFVWDDFTCYPDTNYTYNFVPIKGEPKKLKYESPITIEVKTEALYSNKKHDIFFNRGVASSQSYVNKFFNLAPDKMPNEDMRNKALQWLSRDLDNAIIKFITQAKKGESLRVCVYEFHYLPIVKAFKEALDRGVKVQIIIDAKENEKDREDSFPREANLQAIKKAGIPISVSKKIVIRREARTSAIQHNKFIVFSDKNGMAKEVWTGSTNISMGGIHGQMNVGHWIKDKATAEKYSKYWDILSNDPGGRAGEDRSVVLQKNKELREQVEGLQANIEFNSWDQIPQGITTVFSPRTGDSMLDMYAKMLDSANDLACITLAFGVNNVFKDYLKDNTSKNQLAFLLLEKEDKKNENSEQPFIKLGSSQNVYMGFGAAFEDNLYHWTKEVTTRNLGLNHHVAFIHSKFLLINPLSEDPIVVTGSANFSPASQNENDENMLIIRGDKRVADIYFTEFNRLFNHYYFRSVYQKVKKGPSKEGFSAFLLPDDSWLKKYKTGLLRYKRVEAYSKMKIK